MNSLKQKLRLIGSVLVLGLFVHDAQSAVLIDGFTDFQYAVNGVQYSDQGITNVISDLGVADTDLSNARRSITASPFPNTAYAPTTEVVVEGGKLTIANSANSAGIASVYYTFDTIDLTAFAKAISLNISFIDLNVQVQMIANGSSTHGIHDFGGIGQYYVDFSQFSNPLAFTQLKSFELKLTGPQAWDAEFQLLATVPEPSVTALLVIGLIAIGVISRRKDLLFD